MEYGLFMMPLHPPRRSYADSYDRDVELLVLADKLGYHEAWVGEHITEVWENAPVPELLIAQALALTENIILATGVTMLPLHHPVDTAHRIAMLDHMARGRFYWGIGVRSLPTDLHLYGIEYNSMDEVREQGQEALDVILRLWEAEDGHFGYEGKYYQVHAPETDSGTGTPTLFQTLPETPSAHRRGGHHPRRRHHTHGRGTRLDTNDQRAVPTRAWAMGDHGGWGGQHRKDR